MSLPDELRGDGPCDGCGTPDNPVWFTDSVFWNHVIRPEDPMARPFDREPVLCVNCFVMAVDRAGLRPTGWRLMPEWPWRREQ